MRTSTEWWETTRKDKKKLNKWLRRQHRAENLAANRMIQMAQDFAATDEDNRMIHVIADQEVNHARWILGLLASRGIAPLKTNEESRYWSKTLPGIKSFKHGAAVAAHAEMMRLERIQAIIDEKETDEDIKRVFTDIHKDEVFHAKAFLEMTTAKELIETQENHRLGKEALGLEP